MAVTSRPLTDTRSSGSTNVYWLSAAVTFALYVGALVALALVVQFGLRWGERQLDDLRYGFPRVAQVSGAVGFGDSAQTPTHVMAINSDGQISVIVLPAGDSSRLSVLAGPYLVGADGAYTVPMPSLVDVNADTKLDLVLGVRGEDLVYLNRGDYWSLITPEERMHLLEEQHGS